jgi:hypothetical protein
MPNIFTPSLPNATGPWSISRDDCIGDSLGYINANTNYLASNINALSGNLLTQLFALSALVAYPGAPLQTQSTVITQMHGLQPSTYPSPWVDVPGFSLTLNRRDINGKMRVQATIYNSQNYTHHPPAFRIIRDVSGAITVLGTPGSPGGSRVAATATGNGGAYTYYAPNCTQIDFVDDLAGVPNSVVTYRIQWMLAYLGYAVLNRGAYFDVNNYDANYYAIRTISTMSVTELRG